MSLEIQEEKVSIIIVTYNALEHVSKCLESVLANTHQIHEIIIVDNASNKPTRDYVISMKENSNVKVILNDENRLWSPANNQGIKLSEKDSKYCLLLNSDIEVLRPDWLERLQMPIKKYSKVGITGTQYNFSPIKPTYGAIDGCCFFIKKALITEIGLLDERYPWNGAGYAFTLKAWKNGWYYYHVDEPKILIHYGKRSRISNQIYFQNQKVDKFEINKEIGLKPVTDYFAYVQYYFKFFRINQKLMSYYS